MKRKMIAVFGIAFLFVLAAYAQGPKQPRIHSYSLTIVKYPSTENSFLPAFASVNEPHRAVGYGWNGDEIDFLGAIPFEWRDDVFTTLELLPGYPGAVACCLNNRGDIVGAAFRYYPGTNTVTETPVLWRKGKPMDLGLSLSFPYIGGSASGINSEGQVILLEYYLVSLDPLIYEQHSYLWDKGELFLLPNPQGGTSTEAASISDSGQIVGASWGPAFSNQQATIWIKGQPLMLGTLGGSTSWAASINNRGQVAGGSESSSGELHAFLWDKGMMQDLGTLGGPFSNAIAINNSAQVVGASLTASGEEHAFVWDNGQMQDLNLITPHDPGIVLLRGLAIDHRGYISGIGIDMRNLPNVYTIGFLLKPEP